MADALTAAAPWLLIAGVVAMAGGRPVAAWRGVTVALGVLWAAAALRGELVWCVVLVAAMVAATKILEIAKGDGSG